MTTLDAVSAMRGRAGWVPGSALPRGHWNDLVQVRPIRLCAGAVGSRSWRLPSPGWGAKAPAVCNLTRLAGKVHARDTRRTDLSR
jgi:hypothetical protein